MQQWPHHQNLRHSAGFHGFHAHSPWVVNGWNASNAVRKWRTWRSRAGCSARFWPRRDWIGWCICRICEWGRRRGVRIRRRRWWRTIEWAAMCSIWRSRGREAGWAWRRWTRRLWFLIFACSLECLFENRVEEGSWMDKRVREWLVVRTRNTQCKDKRMSILAFVWRNTWRFQKWSSLSNSNPLPLIQQTFLSPHHSYSVSPTKTISKQTNHTPPNRYPRSSSSCKKRGAIGTSHSTENLPSPPKYALRSSHTPNSYANGFFCTPYTIPWSRSIAAIKTKLNELLVVLERMDWSVSLSIEPAKPTKMKARLIVNTVQRMSMDYPKKNKSNIFVALLQGVSECKAVGKNPLIA